MKDPRLAGIFFALLLLGINWNASAQTRIGLGPELKLYPAGLMTMLQTELHHDSSLHRWNIGIGVNRASRGDMSGLNDDEHGIGPGLALGYRYQVLRRGNTPYVGLRNDLWWIPIQWTDKDHSPSQGETSITIVQPTFELGYRLHRSSFDLLLGVVNGFEINVISNGKDVGQGWITEFQLALLYQL